MNMNMDTRLGHRTWTWDLDMDMDLRLGTWDRDRDLDLDLDLDKEEIQWATQMANCSKRMLVTNSFCNALDSDAQKPLGIYSTFTPCAPIRTKTPMNTLVEPSTKSPYKENFFLLLLTPLFQE